MTLSTLSIAALLFNKASSWGYIEPGNNVSDWPRLYEECGRPRQSPIDISMQNEFANDDYACTEPLELEWTSEFAHYAIVNNGHSLQAMPFHISNAGGADISNLEILDHANDTNIRLTNSFYDTYQDKIHKEYCFDSLHFHWGRHNEEGSEHTINGEMYPLEVHLVHYACDYYKAGAAINAYASEEVEQNDDDNVLAVIGVLFEIGAPNPILERILDDMIIEGIYENTQHAANAHDKLDEQGLIQLYYTHFDVAGLLPDSREMVSYLGSLTTPPCFETVRWHVLKDRMTVSPQQMEQFRMMLGSEDMNDTIAPNYRPPQPLNDRKIYRCVADVEEDVVKGVDGDYSDVDSDSDHDHSSSHGDHDEIVPSSAGTWRTMGIAFGLLFLVIGVVFIYAICVRSELPRKMTGKHDERYMTATMGV